MIAGVKALSAYGTKKPAWHEAMNEATLKYSKQRDTQKRTKRESDNWPKDGYLELRPDRPGLGVEVQEDALEGEYSHWQRGPTYRPDGATGYL